MINFCSNETRSVCIFIFKTTWKSYFKNNEKNTWKFTKKPGKIMEISWNFVSPKKWEPWNLNFVEFGTPASNPSLRQTRRTNWSKIKYRGHHHVPRDVGAPVFTAVQARRINENAAINSSVATFRANDPDLKVRTEFVSGFNGE